MRVTAWALALVLSACALPSQRTGRIAYTPEEFRAELLRRAPELASEDIVAPYEVGDEALERARLAVKIAGPREAAVLALVDVISADPPRGLGLRYDHTITRDARETLVIGRGNCVSLASVLVGLGRGLGWSVYYGEARSMTPERRMEKDLAVSVDHMVVVLLPKAVRAVVDFSGPVTNRSGVQEIDDLRAYAHLVNNRASELVLDARQQDRSPPWEEALAGFSLAVRIEPEFAQGWNNQGVALTRLGRLDEARAAYARAVALDASLESSARHLTVLETRARGQATLESLPSSAAPRSPLPPQPPRQDGEIGER